MENIENSISKSRFKKMLMPLVLILAIGLALYFFTEAQGLKKNPNSIVEKETKSLVTKVGQLLVLPTGETPTVATVSDPEALKDQVFFSKAVKGDKVLIYAQAKKAILYSVSMNKILDVAPLNIGTQKAVTPPVSEKTGE